MNSIKNPAGTHGQGRPVLPARLLPALLAVLLAALLAGCSGASPEQEASALHYFRAGNQAYAKADFRMAISHFEKAAAMAPGSADIQYNLGLALFQAGDYAAAVSAYGRALRLDNDFAEAHHNMALAYDKLYKPNAAHRHFNRYRELSGAGSGVPRAPAVASATAPGAANGTAKSAVKSVAKGAGGAKPAARRPPARAGAKPRAGLPAGSRIGGAGRAGNNTAAKQAPPTNPYKGTKKWWTLEQGRNGQ